jgi:hypothetical protein
VFFSCLGLEILRDTLDGIVLLAFDPPDEDKEPVQYFNPSSVMPSFQPLSSDEDDELEDAELEDADEPEPEPHYQEDHIPDHADTDENEDEENDNQGNDNSDHDSDHDPDHDTDDDSPQPKRDFGEQYGVVQNRFGSLLSDEEDD